MVKLKDARQVIAAAEADLPGLIAVLRVEGDDVVVERRHELLARRRVRHQLLLTAY